MNKNQFSTYTLLWSITLLIAILVFFVGLGDMQLMSLNEGRRALAIKEMFAGGNWMFPTLNGDLYLTKPPLMYWVSCFLSSFIGHVNEWTLRLPSALAALATSVIVCAYVRKYYDHWAGLFALQLLVANVEFVMLARRAEIEMLLTFFCVASILSALMFVKLDTQKRWLYLSYLFLGFAIMTKGPVAFLFVTVPLIAAAIWTKSEQLKQLLINKKAWVICVAVGASWYAVVTYQLGPDIWLTIAKRDMLEKMQGSNGAKPLLSYIGWITVDTLFIVALFLIKPKKLYEKYQNNIDFIVLVFSTVLPLIIFSLFSNKHGKYLLPIYPLLTIILALQIQQIFQTANQIKKNLILILGIALPTGFAIFYLIIEAKVYDYRVSAFSEFGAWSHGAVAPIYVVDDTDSRLIYYSETPIKSLDTTEIKELSQRHENAYLAIETNKLKELGLTYDCKLKSFSPYLKKNKQLEIVGYGDVCKQN